MGKGIDAARIDSPEHAQAMDDFKDQLMLVFVKRLGGKVSVPVEEVDGTGGYVLKLSVIDRVFNFELERKQ